MRRSVRCKHGFCLETVGCPDCGVRVLYGASSHLRRADERRAIGKRAQVLAKPHGPGFGNRNAAGPRGGHARRAAGRST